MDITRSLQRAVRAYSKGSAALAAELDLSPTTLAHKVSPTYPTAFCSPEELLAIMDATNDNGPLQALAEARGCVLLPMPSLSAQAGEVCTARLLAAVKEFGDLVSTAAAAAEADGISDNELKSIEAEGAEALAAIHALISWAQAANQARKPAHLRLA